MTTAQPGIIRFHNETISFSVPKPILTRRWLKSVCREEGKTLGHIDYIFCTDEYLLELNRQFLNHDYYTDILSFPFREDPVEGDIFISVERVRENAEQLELPFDMELRRVMVHGLLHFLGYKDHPQKAKTEMTRLEDHYLDFFSSR